MPDFAIDPQNDPLTLRRHNRLKVCIGILIGALSAVSVVLLWLSSDLHNHASHHLPAVRVFPVSFGMWMLMSVAMMLPTAWNMIVNYLDIALTAKSKALYVPNVSALILGYLTVWALFSVVAAMLQVELIELGLIPRDGGWPSPAFAGGLFIFAGIFEFTRLKFHCLTKCKNPFGTILARFRPSWRRVYRIGLEQGAYCLGCCWVLMLLMFAAGIMNFGWMAILGTIMVAQKHGLTQRFERQLGAGLVLTGLALLALGSA